MAPAKSPPPEIVEANYRAKIAARLDGSAPVIVQAPMVSEIDDIDGRYKAKLAARAAAAANAGQGQAPATKDEPKSDDKGDRPEKRSK